MLKCVRIAVMFVQEREEVSAECVDLADCALVAFEELQLRGASSGECTPYHG